jgi:hypothetical protein
MADRSDGAARVINGADDPRQRGMFACGARAISSTIAGYAVEQR